VNHKKHIYFYWSNGHPQNLTIIILCISISYDKRRYKNWRGGGACSPRTGQKQGTIGATQSINQYSKKTPSHKSSAKNVSGRRNVRARGSIAVVSRYWWSAQPDCDLQEMVCIRVGVRAFALKVTQRGIAHYYSVYLKDKHTSIKCIKKRRV